MNFKVRIGTPLDHRPMMAFIDKMHAENGIFDLDEKSAEIRLMCGLAKHKGLVGIIDGDDGDIAASCGLFLSKFWYTRSYHLEENWLFVNEAYRRKPMARPLLEFAKRTAEQLDMPLLIGVLSSHRTEAKIRLYERQLGKMRGAVFFHDSRSPDEIKNLSALKDLKVA